MSTNGNPLSQLSEPQLSFRFNLGPRLKRKLRASPRCAGGAMGSPPGDDRLPGALPAPIPLSSCRERRSRRSRRPGTDRRYSALRRVRARRGRRTRGPGDRCRLLWHLTTRSRHRSRLARAAGVRRQATGGTEAASRLLPARSTRISWGSVDQRTASHAEDATAALSIDDAHVVVAVSERGRDGCEPLELAGIQGDAVGGDVLF